MSNLRRFCAALLILFVSAGTLAHAQEPDRSAQTAWRLLDYIAVDYEGAVEDGRVVNAAEFAEMEEFAGRVRTLIGALPATPAQASLLAETAQLETAIGAKAPPPDVAARARGLAARLLVSYPTPVAPNAAPDPARGAALYRERCQSCHGARGGADGPAAAGLDPAPIAFTDASRARERSIFALYQVITQGLEGTAMSDFSDLPSDDRWALAFYVGSLAYSDDVAAQGERIWRSNPSARRQIPDLEALTQTTPATLSEALGEDQATALSAYLRRTPSALQGNGGSSLSIARARLEESVAAYEAGNRRRAIDLALAAYLDGVEPVEPALQARDAALLGRVEAAMGEFRAALTNGEPVSAVRDRASAIAVLLDLVERKLAPQNANATSAFLGAFTILLREGLEAMLIVVAMIAFLRKADRPDVLAYVHGGWIAALGAGALTWTVATYLVSISGASRELTEGFGSLIAAVVLVSVGIWMHGKSHAEAWQRYIKEKVSAALSRGSAWFLFLLAFLVVYREVFETILFYAALWSQGSAGAMLAGIATGAVALALIGWLLLRVSARLPIGKFFAWSSVLIAVLAVVLAGKGVSGLQEAGLLDMAPLAGAPRVDLLGLYPTWQGVIAQAATAAIIAGGFLLAGRPAARPAS